MRHAKQRHKLSRGAGHRKALLRNLSRELIEHERIRTSQAKAKALLRAAYLGSYLSAIETGCENLFLTLIGGGAFGNDLQTIFIEILNAHKRIALHRNNTTLKKVELFLFKKPDFIGGFLDKLVTDGIKFTCVGVKVPQ